MSFNKVFELVRQGKVVLFCGAGLSLYADYPSGKQLASILYNALSDQEKKQVDPNLSLDNLTEEFINLKNGNRDELNEILNRTFLKPAAHNHVHQILCRIPQIETVITTNYDTLFEDTYADKCFVIRSSADVPKISSGKTQIIKIHGDLSLPDSILISKSDYTRFFDAQKQEVMWTVVKERIATKNVLFIGYSLEDINIESIISRINQELGTGANEMFLLSPGEKDHKVAALKRKGVQYINSYAEPFLQALEQDIKDHANKDFHNQQINAEIFRKIMQNYDINPILATEKDRFRLKAVQGLSRPLTGQLQIKVPGKDKKMIGQIRDLFQNKSISELHLHTGNVSELEMRLNDVNFPTSKGEGYVLRPVPGIVADIDLTFKNGSEYEETKLEVYKVKKKLVFVVLLPCGKLKISVPNKNLLVFPKLDLHITFEHVTGYKKINDEFQTYKFLGDFVSSGGFTVAHPKMEKMEFGLQTNQELIRESEKHLNYLKGLKQIEKFFNVKFGEIKDITKQTYERLCWFRDIMSGEEQICDWHDEIKFTATDPEKTLKGLQEFDKSDVRFTISSRAPTIIRFHEVDINVGYQTTRIVEAYVANKGEVEKNPDSKIIVKSKTNQRGIIYNKKPREEKTA